MLMIIIIKLSAANVEGRMQICRRQNKHYHYTNCAFALKQLLLQARLKQMSLMLFHTKSNTLYIDLDCPTATMSNDTHVLALKNYKL